MLIDRPIEEEILPDDENVIALGPLAHDAVLAGWRRCSVGVVSSLQPVAFSVLALEAMAAVARRTASRRGGLHDTVVDGGSGLLVAPNDPPAPGEALDRLIGHEPLRTRLAAGTAAPAESFSGSVVRPAVRAVCDRALATRRQRLGAAATHS